MCNPVSSPVLKNRRGKKVFFIFPSKINFYYEKRDFLVSCSPCCSAGELLLLLEALEWCLEHKTWENTEYTSTEVKMSEERFQDHFLFLCFLICETFVSNFFFFFFYDLMTIKKLLQLFFLTISEANKQNVFRRIKTNLTCDSEIKFRVLKPDEQTGKKYVITKWSENKLFRRRFCLWNRWNNRIK